MSALPARFPRASLIQNAAMLESRINKLLDETQQLIDESEEHGDYIRTRKLGARFNALDDARTSINEVREALFLLP